MNAWHKVPGFSGLSGSVDASTAGGRVYLSSSKTELDLPQVFPQRRIQLDRLDGQIDWEHPQPGAFDVRLSSLAFSSKHFAGNASGTYSWREGSGPGTIDLSARLSRADGSQVARYLPLGSLMGEKARAWVAGAVVSGRASDVSLRLRGDLHDFPYADPSKGEFRVSAHFSDGVFQPAPKWPRIQDIDGELMFDRDKMTIVGNAGSVYGAKLSDVRVGIESLKAPQKLLEIAGTAEGPSAAFLAYIAGSPVHGMVKGFTDSIHASGSGTLKLKLELPLGRLEHSKVAGDFRLDDNSVTLSPQLPAIEHATGTVSFTESSVTLHDVQGRFLGGAVTISGGTAPGVRLRAVARGRAEAAELEPLLPSRWRGFLSGAAGYVATRDAARRQRAAQRRVVAAGRGEHAAGAARQGRGQRAAAAHRAAAGHQRRARPHLGQARRPARGGDSAPARKARSSPCSAPRSRSGRGAGRRCACPSARGCWCTARCRRSISTAGCRWSRAAASAAGPAAVDLKAGTLDAFGKRLRGVTLKAAPTPKDGRPTCRPSELAGDLAYRARDGGKLIARLARFRIPEDAPGHGAGAGQGDEKEVKDLPALDLIADRFTFRGKQLGRIEVAAQHAGADWRIERLAMVNPDASMSGSGVWRGGATPSTKLKFELKANDVGKFLDRIGYKELVKGGKATLGGTLSWSGDPLGDRLPSLSGALTLTAKDGQLPRDRAGNRQAGVAHEPADAAAAHHARFPRRVLQGLPVR